MMQRLFFLVGFCAALGGCSLLSVYKIDIPQGSPLTAEQVSKLQVGMSQEQVIYLLGSPTLKDVMAPMRWDYLYDFTPGTYGKKADVPASHKKERLSIFFDGQQRVSRIEGVENIPAVQRTVPIDRSSF